MVLSSARPYALPSLQSAEPPNPALLLARRFPAVVEDMIVHYQPIVRCSDGSVAAVEALVRFPRPDGTLRHTAQTLRRIYESGHGDAFDRRVVAAAVAENARWLEHGIDVGVHVNVSATTIEAAHDDVFGNWIASMGFGAPRLVIEVTERDSFLDPARAADFVTSCRRRGIEIAIDDFGCGYSTFELLRDLAADIVKIDRSFTARLPHCARTRTIVHSLIRLAHDLDMRVVAEGVETGAQYAWLTYAGCDELQGYAIARPMPGEVYIRWQRNHV
jgi:EAL domain-containing protein (putative c-di-GMP-specific phosphodiesterase class I)